MPFLFREVVKLYVLCFQNMIIFPFQSLNVFLKLFLFFFFTLSFIIQLKSNKQTLAATFLTDVFPYNFFPFIIKLPPCCQMERCFVSPPTSRISFPYQSELSDFKIKKKKKKNISIELLPFRGKVQLGKKKKKI